MQCAVHEYRLEYVAPHYGDDCLPKLFTVRCFYVTSHEFVIVYKTKSSPADSQHKRMGREKMKKAGFRGEETFACTESFV
jgi:hypothetical protein